MLKKREIYTSSFGWIIEEKVIFRNFTARDKTVQSSPSVINHFASLIYSGCFISWKYINFSVFSSSPFACALVSPGQAASYILVR